MTRFSRLIIILALVSFAASPATATELSTIVSNTITRFIQPGYSRLAQQAVKLRHSATGFCQKPDHKKSQILQDEFRNTVLAWSGIEAVRFGPIGENHNFERMYFWPDPKGIGIRQVAKLLRKISSGKEAPGSWNQNRFKSKSVALQGLGALEYLLFSKANAWLEKSHPQHRVNCQYILAIVANIHEISHSADQGWQDTSARAIAAC